MNPTLEAASEASIGRTTAYRYFPNSRALLAATHPEIEKDSLLGPDPPEDPLARLEIVAEGQSRLLLEYEPEYRTQLRQGMGERVQQRRSLHGFEEAYAGERPEALLAEEVDSGAHVLLALSEQEDEQGLRKAAGELRNLRLRSDESPDGEAVGSFMRLFGQFLYLLV